MRASPTGDALADRPAGSRAGANRTRWAAAAARIRDELDTAMRKLLSDLLRDESGTETLEWGLVCGLIVVGAIAAITLIGPKVTDMWNDVNTALPAAD